MDNTAAQALIRFGLGRRGQGAASQRHQLPGFTAKYPFPTLAQMDRRSPTGLPPSGRDRADRPAPGTMGAVGKLFRAEMNSLVSNALTTPTPFRERLVWFWANHFTISLRGGRTGALGGDFIRTAIRPNVTGPFSAMLLAVMRHPAMLLYLDNAGSIGPDSRAGLRTGKGLNENLARESLELHTVSPECGYTQADVTSYARILTGWSVANGATEEAGFRFRPNLHEPGEQTLLGQNFPRGRAGRDRGARCARHPSRDLSPPLATKLVQHFVADTTTPGSGAAD